MAKPDARAPVSLTTGPTVNVSHELAAGSRRRITARATLREARAARARECVCLGLLRGEADRALAGDEAEVGMRVSIVLHALALLLAALVAGGNAAEGDRDVRRPRDALVETGAVEELHVAGAAERRGAGRMVADLRASVLQRLVHGGRVDLEC